MSSSTTTKKNIPAHLKPYLSQQHYQNYTPINQAVWRYVMRQNVRFFKSTAHQAYTSGRENTGIHLERIPRLEEMDQALAPFGWGAVSIDGLIPGVAFFEFQANGLLPIATDIRTLNHILYTPAPDIIHEAAGHAPILADPEYAAYVKRFGEIGSKALASKEEHEVFEATRKLSIVMEDNRSTEIDIQKAQQELKEKLSQVSTVSEAAQIGRLYWWTVEYGLIGELTDPKIYGAGLLSSIGESQHCLSNRVKKLPFDLEACITTDYDVTKPQPQLFVCQSFQELTEAVECFADRMAFRVGGTESLEKAIASGSTATAVFDTGLQVTGTFAELRYDKQGKAIYLKTHGPTALSLDRKEIVGHGKQTHADGFGAPIGSVSGLENVRIGKKVDLHYDSGVQITGIVRGEVRKNGQRILLQLEECTVTLGDEILFDPSWGIYDLVIGENIVSVYAGAADPEMFYNLPEREEIVESQVPMEWSPLDHLYQAIRDIREGKTSIVKVHSIHQTLQKDFPDDWLARIELVEILMTNQDRQEAELTEVVRKELDEISRKKPELTSLIQNGLTCLD
ncbi:aromatic amino acid hydroxylase [Risungbinella massiliensis]|uniref:aromatic amino acid hydroxylase n=1 Tax=Risungbinella massiliensis TaxID=1329796 RepID=UPI0005CB8DAE|nr:aromatic amino acid hydroxylase [Risungbinella massiliensis]